MTELGQQQRYFVITVVSVISWYASNIAVVILNKYLLTNLKFSQPVFLTCCHMLACVVLGLLLSLARITPLKPLHSRKQLLKVVLLACIFCTTIVLGNASLRYIPVSFNQAVGSTTPFFTAIIAFALLGMREHVYTYYALAPICIGVVISSGGEPSFHAWGFTFCLASAAGRALKSVIQGMIMTDPNEKLDPMSLLLYMSGVSVLLLVPFTIALEPRALDECLALLAANKSFSWWLAGNSLIAYAVNLTNFLVTKYTSALTLQVLGNAKGVVAAVVSVGIFRNVVTWQGCVGYAITVVGVYWYSESKRWSKQQAQMAERLAAREAEETKRPLLSGVDSASEHLHTRPHAATVNTSAQSNV